MKKVKIMLTSLALLAVVGGALAFKAKYQTAYCSAPTQLNVACTEIFCDAPTISTTVGATGTKVCTTTPNPSGGCSGLKCTTTSTSLTTNGE